MKQILVLLGLFLFVGFNSFSQEPKSKKKNPYQLPETEREWMRNATIQQLKGCRVKGAGGTWIHTPDGVGNYKALWTRDSYYFVEYAGDLLDADEIKATIYYLIKGQRADGCIPDRVNKEGVPVYSPGAPNNPIADHALDNGAFMAMLVCSYVNQFGDKQLFMELEPKLKKGLDHISRAEGGLVYNHPDNPQCVYGFTDIVQKTGNLLFCSLLYHKACVEMEKLCEKYNCGNPMEYNNRAELITKNINDLWDEQSGMFLAADVDCKQIDLWGSAYAVEIGLASKKQADAITNYFVTHKDEIMQRRQFSHLAPGDSHWGKLFRKCPEGTYQNGAYWSTPLAWIIPVYARHSQKLAQNILLDVLKDFKANGITECVNGEYYKVPNYVVSATNVYGLTR